MEFRTWESLKIEQRCESMKKQLTGFWSSTNCTVSKTCERAFFCCSQFCAPNSNRWFHFCSKHPSHFWFRVSICRTNYWDGIVKRNKPWQVINRWRNHDINIDLARFNASSWIFRNASIDSAIFRFEIDYSQSFWVELKWRFEMEEEYSSRAA